ncbi:MAG: BspA family leucine-rich repeat surface protein [Saprospirales bacterium]|nr:MAG: BspA family leucine-rich repeat surface protein [Saprospirales bacterium]
MPISCLYLKINTQINRLPYHGFLFLVSIFLLAMPLSVHSQQPFITTWKTDLPGPSEDNQITIPGHGSNYTIEWEEVGNPSNNGTATGNGFTTITFPHPGIYQVSISGDFHRIQFGQSAFNSFGDPEKLLSVNQWGDIQWSNFERAFSFCKNMTSTATDIPNLNDVTSTAYMFLECEEFDSDIGTWDMSNVVWMTRMFMNALSFNGDISNWDVGNVVYMRYMFSGAVSFDQNLGLWNIENVITVEHMLELSGLSCENYSATLDGWASLNSLNNGLFLHAEGLEYSLLGSFARDILEQNFGWEILGDYFNEECGCDPFEIEIIGEEVVNCLQEEIELIVEVSNINNFQVDWYSPDGNIISPPDLESIWINAGGIYFATVTDENTLCVVMDSVIIQENFDIPIVTIEESATLDCNLNSIWLNSDNGSQDLQSSYLWTTVNGSIISSPDSSSVQVDTAGWYYLEVNDEENGCAYLDSVFVAIDKELPEVTIEPGSILGCEQATVWLDGSPSSEGPELEFQWSTNEGNILSAPDSSAIEVDSGGWYFFEVLNQQNGCMGLDSVFVEKNNALPKITIEVESELGCEQGTIWLDGSNSSQGPEFEYHWSTIEGNILSAPDSSAIEVDSGGWYFFEVLNQQNGCMGLDSVFVEKNNALPKITIEVESELGCEQGTIWLDGSNSSQGPEFKYHWSTIEGNILSALDSLSIEVDSDGWYFFEVINQQNGCTGLDSFFVERNEELPEVIIEVESEIGCEQTTVWLDGSSSSQGSEFEYHWSTNEGNILSIPDSIAIEVNAAGWYFFEVINQQNGCTGLDSAFVEKNDELPEVVIEAGMQLDCEQTTIWLDGSSSSQGSEFEYHWSTNEGNILSAPDSIWILINSKGWYYFEVINQDNGCTGFDSVFVDRDVDVPVVIIEASMEFGCEQTSVKLDGSSSSQGPSYAYLWSTTDGSILSSPDSTTIEVGATGWYFLQITNSENGCVAMDSVLVAQQSPDLELTAIAQSGFCAGGELQLTAGPDSLDTYTWHGPAGFYSEEINPLIESAGVEYSGTYELVASLGTCEFHTEVEVEIFPLPSFDFVVDSIVCEGEQGFIEITNVSGGLPPYTYSFDQAGNFSGNPLAGPLFPGVYLLRVRDTRGCTNEDIPSVVLHEGPPCEEYCDYMPEDIYIELQRYDRQKVNVLQHNQLSSPYYLSAVSSNSELLVGLEYDAYGNISFSVRGNFVEELSIRYRICHSDCDNCGEATIYLSNRELQNIVPTSMITPDQLTNRFLQFSDEPVEGSELWIYNRWGEQIYHSRDYQNDWGAGGFPGGVYFYVFRVYGLTIKSSLTVIR